MFGSMTLTELKERAADGFYFGERKRGRFREDILICFMNAVPCMTYDEAYVEYLNIHQRISRMEDHRYELRFVDAVAKRITELLTTLETSEKSPKPAYANPAAQPVLLVVDMQTGYPVEIAKEFRDTVKRLTALFEHVFTLQYENNKETPVYQRLGWKYLMPGTTKVFPEFQQYPNFIKSTYGGATPELVTYLRFQGFTQIFVCGVYTEACVLVTCLELFDRGFDVTLVEDGCKGSRPGLHETAVELLHYNLNGQVVKIKDIIKSEGS